MLRLLDGRSFRELAELAVPAPDLQFINVAFSPTGATLVAMYEIGDGRTDDAALRRAERPAPRAPGLGWPIRWALTDFAAFTPDGRGLLTAARDPAAIGAIG